jgi:hypothetical protein
MSEGGIIGGIVGGIFGGPLGALVGSEVGSALDNNGGGCGGGCGGFPYGGYPGGFAAGEFAAAGQQNFEANYYQNKANSEFSCFDFADGVRDQSLANEHRELGNQLEAAGCRDSFGWGGPFGWEGGWL